MNTGVRLLDRGILQPAEARGEGKGLIDLGTPLHRGVSQMLKPVLRFLRCKVSTAQSPGCGSNPLQRLHGFAENLSREGKTLSYEAIIIGLSINKY